MIFVYNNIIINNKYIMGNSYNSVIHARLRNNCSSLNNDLFRNHVRDNPLCEWCGVMEDATYFFFHCIKYIGERQVFNDTVRYFQPLTINLILFGSENWNIEPNMVLFRFAGQVWFQGNFLFKLFFCSIK